VRSACGLVQHSATWRRRFGESGVSSNTLGVGSERRRGDIHWYMIEALLLGVDYTTVGAVWIPSQPLAETRAYHHWSCVACLCAAAIVWNIHQPALRRLCVVSFSREAIVWIVHKFHQPSKLCLKEQLFGTYFNQPFLKVWPVCVEELCFRHIPRRSCLAVLLEEGFVQGWLQHPHC